MQDLKPLPNLEEIDDVNLVCRQISSSIVTEYVHHDRSFNKAHIKGRHITHTGVAWITSVTCTCTEYSTVQYSSRSSVEFVRLG